MRKFACGEDVYKKTVLLHSCIVFFFDPFRYVKRVKFDDESWCEALMSARENLKNRLMVSLDRGPPAWTVALPSKGVSSALSCAPYDGRGFLVVLGCGEGKRLYSVIWCIVAFFFAFLP